MPASTASAPIVVVGGGLAAGTVVTELREGGYDGPIAVFADEAHPPYERPPLSKDFLLDKGELPTPLVHARGLVRRARTSTCAPAPPSTAIDPPATRVRPRPAEHAVRPAACSPPDRAPRHLAAGRRQRRPGGLPPHHRRLRAACERRFTDGFAARDHRRRLDRPRGRRAPPATPAPRSTVLESARPAAAARARPRGRRRLRRPAPRARRRPAHRRRRSPRITRARRRGRRAIAGTATPSTSTCSSSASGSSPTPSSPRPPGSPSTTASAPTRRLRTSARRTSTPPATSPTPTTRSSATRCASSTGTPPSSTARSWRANLLGDDDRRRRAALLLHRPVRPRHGVRRQPRPRGLRPGRRCAGDVERRRRRSPPGGCAATGSWPGMHANDWDAIDEVRRIVGPTVDADRLADEDRSTWTISDPGPTSHGKHPGRPPGRLVPRSQGESGQSSSTCHSDEETHVCVAPCATGRSGRGGRTLAAAAVVADDRAAHRRARVRHHHRPAVRTPGRTGSRGREARGFYDARYGKSGTAQAHHRPVRQRRPQPWRDQGLAQSMPGQAVFDLDGTTGTVRMLTRLDGFLTGKSNKRPTHDRPQLRQGQPRGPRPDPRPTSTRSSSSATTSTSAACTTCTGSSASAARRSSATA